METISSRAFISSVTFESYGVRVRLSASDDELLEEANTRARQALTGNFKLLESEDRFDQEFSIWSGKNGRLHLSKNGKPFSDDDIRSRFFKFFDSMLRIAVAEYAPERVFVHSGAVGIGGRAIIFPGDSFSGKTTLVAELVKRGAEYYSDEYAVFDEAGLLHAFPRDLSFRADLGGIGETSIAAEDIGGRTGTQPIPVAAVVLTQFSDGSTWQPVEISRGVGLMELIPHTISRNLNAEFALKVLNTALSDAIIVKSPRGEAEDTAINLLNFFDNKLNLAKIS